MNVAICVIAAGTRSRSRPRIRSRMVVVPTSSSEVSRPRVALAMMFQPPSSPSTDSDRPATLTRSPAPRKGSANASATNGSSIVARRASRPGGTRARAATSATRAAYTPKAQNASRGVLTTATVNATAEAILTSGGSRRTGESPGRNRRCASCPVPTDRCLLRRCGVAVPVPGTRRRVPPADQPEQATADHERDQHSEQPGQTGAECFVVDAPDPVVGEHAVRQVVVAFRLCHAGAVHDLAVLVESAPLQRGVLQPVGTAGGEDAHHPRQQQADHQTADEEPAVPFHATPPVAGTLVGRAARNAYTRSGRTRATVATVAAEIRPSPIPISTCTPAMVAATCPSPAASSTPPPIQYCSTKASAAATTLTTEARKTVTASPAAVRGSSRSRSATTRIAAPVLTSAMLVMLMPSAVSPPSANTSACTISTTDTHSAAIH